MDKESLKTLVNCSMTFMSATILVWFYLLLRKLNYISSEWSYLIFGFYFITGFILVFGALGIRNDILREEKCEKREQELKEEKNKEEFYQKNPPLHIVKKYKFIMPENGWPKE